MKTPLFVAGAGLVWWIFFEWMRGWKRNRTKGTQHLCLLGMLGLAIFIGGLIGTLISWNHGNEKTPGQLIQPNAAKPHR